MILDTNLGKRESMQALSTATKISEQQDVSIV